MGSDHCPFSVLLSHKQVLGPKPFYFESYWIDDEECHQIINFGWQKMVPGGPATNWVAKLDQCRRDLKLWSKTKYGSRKEQLLTLSKRLEEMQGNIDQPRYLIEAEAISKSIDDLWKIEEQWKQQSRINWLSAGDKDTKFFHLSTIQRRQKNIGK
ncbi:unnamed protein product [Prunus brigantina]